jgi:hypothetical protein
MKKVLLILTLLLASTSTWAQTNWGKIILANRNIPTVSGTGGGNGNGTYNVPIWDAYGGTGNGAGDLVGGVTVGIFLPGWNTPLATTLLRTDANSQFFATSATPVDVPGVYPGESAILIVRAWQGPSREWAQMNGHWQEWYFCTKPLGGIPPGGGPEVPTPNMTGWGIEDGRGLRLQTLGPPQLYPYIHQPNSGNLAPAEVLITGRTTGYTNSSSKYVEITNFIVTNIVVSLGCTRFNVPNPSNSFSFKTPPLAAGSYLFQTMVRGHWVDTNNVPVRADGAESFMGQITVDGPVDIVLTQPTLSNGQFTFRYTANPYFNYHVLRSTDLQTWQTIDTNTPFTSPALYSTPAAETSGAYYRLERAQ